jgi:hypothetical protein
MLLVMRNFLPRWWRIRATYRETVESLIIVDDRRPRYGNDPAMSMGDTHRIRPKMGTIAQLDGSKTSLDKIHKYPVKALCETCGKTIWTDRFLRGPWEHA